MTIRIRVSIFIPVQIKFEKYRVFGRRVSSIPMTGKKRGRQTSRSETEDTLETEHVRTDTDRIVAAALKDEQQERRQKLGRVERHGSEYLSESDDDESIVSDEGEERNGRLEQEIEDNGPIQESLVDVAHVKRAALRKGKVVDVEDTGLVADIQRAEEGFAIHKDIERDHGIELEAFNLIEEREKGYFDREGNYVERKKVEEEEDEEADAWLEDGKDKEVVDEATRKKIEERMRNEREDEPRAMNAYDIARIQYKISEILLDGETVARALKRLAGPSRKAKDKHVKRTSEIASSDKASFDDLTEFATILLDTGENDVYNRDKIYFQRAASVYIDLDDDHTKRPETDGNFQAGEEESEDMFASDSGEDHQNFDNKKTVDTSFSSWPVGELKRFCEEHGKSCAGITEKDDLVHLAIETEHALAERVRNATSSSMNGAIFDPESGYWMSKDRCYFWDVSQQSWKLYPPKRDE